MRLKVPETDIPVLASIAELSSDAAQKFLRALSEAEPRLSRSEMAQAIAAAAQLNDELVADFLRVLSVLYIIRDNRGTDLDEFVDVLANAAGGTKEPRLKLDEARGASFKSFFKNALSAERSLGVLAKGLDLLREQERVFCTARVFSDLRPIFGRSPDEKPQASLILHTLKIEHHMGSKMREFFLVLDSKSIRELRTVLDRAISKEHALEEMSKGYGLPPLSLDRH